MGRTRWILWLALLLLTSTRLFATTWYIRSDGGTRYSSEVPSGQCDGKSDLAYPRAGANRHCAFNDFRSMWDNDSGVTRYPTGGNWLMSGGDTVIIRGCASGPNQVNGANPNCRIGWDRPYGGKWNDWCYYVNGGSYSCYNPPIPAGTAAHHTRILGQNYATCNAGGTDPKGYRSNLAQIFGGFSVQYTLNLQSTQYVDVECMEITTHNGQCSTTGSPAYPRGCSTSPPLDDYGQNGIVTNNASSHITLQDVYIHGFNSSGLQGPIGGPITMSRVSVSFNAFAGWNFDDGHDTPDAPGSQILASYVTMVGNGCSEQYPVVNTFSALACHDSNSGGFGDAWSGQDSSLASFTCDHCVMAYNTKDAFIGPHTQIATLTITNSQSYGNMGAQWKWTSAPGGIVTFTNNVTTGNCARYADPAHPISGATHSFAASSGRAGAFLSNYCRAAGNAVSISGQQNSRVLFANNTFVDNSPTIIDINCGPNGESNGQCATAAFTFTNNIFLGYKQNNEAPGLFYFGDRSIRVNSNNNIEYGIRNGDTCGAHGIICSDPLLVNEPEQTASRTGVTFLDDFNFSPRASSPGRGHGVSVTELTHDFFGRLRSNPASIGAVEPSGASSR